MIVPDDPVSEERFTMNDPNPGKYVVSVVSYGKDRTELKVHCRDLLPPDVKDPKAPCGQNLVVKAEDIPPGTETIEFTVSK